MRFWCVVLLIFFALCLRQQPGLDFALKEKPDYVLVSQGGEFMFELENKGRGEAFGVNIDSDDDFVTIEAPRIV